MKTIDALLDELFDGRPLALRPILEHWLLASRRFTAFVEVNRDKIHKKIRLKSEPAEMGDLAWELEVAFLLHNDKRFTVSYEAYSRAQPFGPDYRVRYTTSIAFNVEVTRVRNVIEGDSARRLAETACNKLHQVMPNMPNVVVVQVPDLTTERAGFAAEMANVRRSAEKRAPDALSRLDFDSTPAFIKAIERLSAVIVCNTESSPAFLWHNPQAKMPLPAKVITALRNCFTTSN